MVSAEYLGLLSCRLVPETFLKAQCPRVDLGVLCLLLQQGDGQLGGVHHDLV